MHIANFVKVSIMKKMAIFQQNKNKQQQQQQSKWMDIYDYPICN